jgi:DNA-binding transcriptional MerR regulator
MVNTGLFEDTKKLSVTTGEGFDAIYRIGNLANEFNVTLRTLRFYEDKGLITPKRNGTTRLYNNQDRARLKLILFAKRVGFSLVEIREILMTCDKRGDARNPLASSKARFQTKLTELKAQKIDIEQAIEELSNQLASKDGPFAE